MTLFDKLLHKYQLVLADCVNMCLSLMTRRVTSTAMVALLHVFFFCLFFLPETGLQLQVECNLFPHEIFLKKQNFLHLLSHYDKTTDVHLTKW